jgi:hypothetical protein
MEMAYDPAGHCARGKAVHEPPLHRCPLRNIAIAIDFDFDFDSDSDFDSYGVATHLKPHEPRPAMVNGIASELLFPVFFQS